MTVDETDAFGNRVAVARRAHRMTQQQLAHTAAISVSLLRKIEQGARAATAPVRAAITQALDLDDFTPASNDRHIGGRVHDAIPAIRRAMDCFDLPDDGPIRPLGELRAEVAKATSWRLESRYVQLAELVPCLLPELTRAVHSLVGHDRETAFGLLAMAYRAADAIADKHGYTDLSARAIELIRWAAANSGDPVLSGMAGYVRSELFFNGPQCPRRAARARYCHTIHGPGSDAPGHGGLRISSNAGRGPRRTGWPSGRSPGTPHRSTRRRPKHPGRRVSRDCVRPIEHSRTRGSGRRRTRGRHWRPDQRKWLAATTHVARRATVPFLHRNRPRPPVGWPPGAHCHRFSAPARSHPSTPGVTRSCETPSQPCSGCTGSPATPC